MVLVLPENYCTWDCRGDRREYACFNVTLIAIPALIEWFLPLHLLFKFLPIWIILGLLLLIPVVCSHIRRLHDLNWSGWWVILILLLGQLPLGGILFTLTLSLLPGSKGENHFGRLPY